MPTIPTPEELEKVRDSCLVWCNEMRAIRNKEPLSKLPKGKIGDPRSCPCGKATGLHVSTQSYWAIDGDSLPTVNLGDLPKPVVQFVDLFDDRRYPDLIEE